MKRMRRSGCFWNVSLLFGVALVIAFLFPFKILLFAAAVLLIGLCVSTYNC